MMPVATFAAILLCVLLETLSTLCFKQGVDEDEANAADKGFIRMVATTPVLWAGILFWGIELLLWVHVLETTPLSLAFPVMSLVYCTVPLAGRFLLNEPLPRWQWLGTASIALGVALVGSSGI